MTSRAALFALLALWGVGVGGSLPARAEDPPGDSARSETRAHAAIGPAGLVNRVWQRADTGDQPGVIRIFLSDGTLVMDSCWETHRLSAWTVEPDGRLSWSEDGTDVRARVKSLGLDSLVLQLDLKGSPIEEHYTAAAVPSVCPDVPA